jgi:ABC-type transporter MlaC component
VTRATRTFAACLLAASLFASRTARAAEGATDAVKAANERVRTALDAYSKAQGAERKAAREKVRAAVETLLDFEALVKAAAGRHWEGMSAPQRHRFTEALRGVMQASYLSKMSEQGTLDVNKVRSDYLSEEPAEGKTLVKTKLHSGEDEAAVDYLLAHEKHGWRAVDVVTEGTSLVDTYREQIDALWPKGGYEKVVARLEKKRKSLEAKEAPAAPPAQ